MQKNMISKVTSALLVSASLSIVGCGGSGGSSSSPTTADPVVQDAPVTGTAFVSGTIATASSASVAAARFSASAAATVDETATATLIIDSNDDGVFGDAKDAVFSASVDTNGAFNFGNVAVHETAATKAQLTVTKQGYAPYTKIISLSDKQSVSVVADAASKPLHVQAVNLSAVRAAGAMNSSFLKLGTTNDGLSMGSYARILSFSQMQAEADVPLSSDVQTETVIPLASVPDSVTVINAEMQSFDPTDQDDSANFPGDYIGVGETGTADKQRLVSVGFDLMSLTDQNGDAISLDSTALSAASKLLPQAVDYTQCLRTSTRKISGTLLDEVIKLGDDDATTPQFEIPLWYYNSGAGNWQYLGQAEVFEDAELTIDFNASTLTSTAYANMCITENWGKYVNLDYSFALETPKNICVSAVDQNDVTIPDLYVYSQIDTAYEGRYLNDQGKASLALTSGNIEDYKFYYQGTLTGWSNVAIQDSEITSGGETGCDHTISLTVVNPYSATLRISAQEKDGTPAKEKWVSVYSSDWNDYYSRSVSTDADGVATFKVKPNVSYEVSYQSAKAAVTINGSLVTPETADDGRNAAVTLKEVDVAPQVYTYMYNASLSDKAESVNFFVYAWDENGDKISMRSLTLNGTVLAEGKDYTKTYSYNGGNYDYFEAKLDLSSATVSAISPASLTAGTYTLSAAYTDGKNSAASSSGFTVTADRAPVISGVYVLQGGVYKNINNTLVAGASELYLSAYDPDGDTVTTTVTLDSVTIDPAAVTLADGDHTLVVSAEANGKTASKTFTFFVGNRAPVITSFGASTYLIDTAKSETFTLYAYATDAEGSQLTLSMIAPNGSVTALAPSYSGSNYFKSGAITIDANSTYTLVANDGDKNSTVKSVTITTYATNQAPVFSQALLDRTVAAGASETFTCAATDPEGDSVSYKWTLDGVAQTQTGGTFTHTFATSGVYAVSCTATDANSFEPGVATSTASVTVYDATASGNLVINTTPGLVVALHDTATLLTTPANTKVADSNGNATFTVSGTDRATFSVSVGPDVMISAADLFKDELNWHANEGQWLCQSSTATNKPAECTTFDWCALSSSTTIPNWLFDFVMANDVDEMAGSGILAANADTNKDGGLDTNEFYTLVLSVVDANKDGKVSWSEWEDGDVSIRSEFFVNVPVRTYNIEFSPYGSEPYYNYMHGGCGTARSTVSLTGFDPDVSISASGSYWSYANTDENGSLSMVSDYANAQSDGLFSSMFRYTDYNNGTTSFSFLQDKTAAQIANVALTPADFTLSADTAVSITTNPSATYDYLWINPLYKGLYLDVSISIYDALTGQYSAMYLNNSAFYYGIFGHVQFTDPVTYASVYKSHNNYYGDGTLLSAYNTANYPHLDVTPTLNPAGSVDFAGSDLSKVNGMSLQYYAYDYNDTTMMYYDASIVFHYTVVPSTVIAPDFAAVLPASISQYLAAAPTYEQMWGNMEEVKGLSEAQYIDLVTSPENYDYYNMASTRYVNFNIPTGVAPLSAATRTVKPKFARPFSIGYDLRKPFAK